MIRVRAAPFSEIIELEPLMDRGSTPLYSIIREILWKGQASAPLLIMLSREDLDNPLCGGGRGRAECEQQRRAMATAN